MARTSKSRGAKGYNGKSGKRPVFKMMGSSPVEQDEFPGLLPEVKVGGRTSRDNAAQAILDASRNPDIARMRGQTTRQMYSGPESSSVSIFDLSPEDRKKLYAEVDRKRP